MIVKTVNAIMAGFRKIITGLIMLSIVISFAGHATENDMVLELKDIQFFKVQQSDAHTVTLKLSGLVFHSSLAIKKVSTASYDESLQIIVYLTPVSGSLSGNLDYSIDVPDSINKISFGKIKSIIWTRDKGVVRGK